MPDQRPNPGRPLPPTRREPRVGAGSWRWRLARAGTRLRADVSFAVIDAFIVALAYLAALVLRFMEGGPLVPLYWFESFFEVLPIIIVVHVLANVALGAYGHVWEYASVGEASRLALAGLIAAAVLIGGVLAWRDLFGVIGPVPISVVAIGALLTLGGMGAIRFRSRMFSFKRMEGALLPRRALVVGTGRAAAQLARQATGSYGLQVVGFVAPSGPGGPKMLAGLPVLGEVSDLPDLIERHGADEVVVAVDGPDQDMVLRRVVDRCLEIEVRLRILPGLDAVLGGRGGVRDVRDLELTDLLPRPEVQTDLEQMASVLAGRKVLVTGAGGSIGSEIVRQVLAFGPAEVVALDHDETHLYESMVGWSEGGDVVQPVLLDVRDRLSLTRFLRRYGPEVIFHAAAHKHVPILEYWPEEAVKTNVLGTAHLLDALRQHCDPERFVLISTDKAVNPANVMGASKRLAEMLVQSAARHDRRCVYTAVRFGNVLGSRGSVVPTFVRQIKRGGPVTVTEPDMVRYFMTVGEAVELVLQAAALAEGGEVFVLDMGEPLRVLDLAHRLIRLAGLVPGRDVEVVTIGRRPGEKLREALSESPLEPSGHPKIRISRPSLPGPATLFDMVSALERLAEEGDDQGIREILYGLVGREWAPGETIILDGLEDVIRWR